LVFLPRPESRAVGPGPFRGAPAPDRAPRAPADDLFSPGEAPMSRLSWWKRSSQSEDRLTPPRRWRAAPRLEALEDRLNPVGWGPTDFLVGGFNGNQIAVYNSSLAFQGYLDSAFSEPIGLDFRTNGNLIGAGRFPSQVRQYSPAGTQVSSFTNTSV